MCLTFTASMFVFGRTLAYGIPFLTNLAFAALFILNYLISKRSDNFVYLVPVCRLLITAMFFYLTRNMVLNSSQCGFKELFILFADEAYLALTLLTDTIFLSPSLKITLLTHTPTFIFGHIIQIFVRYD